MKSFQYKLPTIKYRIKVKTGNDIRKFLESYGCELDNHVEEDISNVITVYCGGLYNYDVGSTGGSSVVVTPKEFKRIVREAVGDAE
jgi:hypothetical protein